MELCIYSVMSTLSRNGHRAFHRPARRSIGFVKGKPTGFAWKVLMNLMLTTVASVCGSLENSCLADTVSDSIRESADAMQGAFMKGDFKTFISYNYPTLVEKVGGQEKMQTVLRKRRQEIENQGIKFLSVQVDAPDKVLVSDSGSFALVPMTLQMKVIGGKITQESHLLAISLDKQKTWSFIDAAGVRSESMKAVVPALPDALVIPPSVPPLFESDDAMKGRLREDSAESR